MVHVLAGGLRHRTVLSSLQEYTCELRGLPPNLGGLGTLEGWLWAQDGAELVRRSVGVQESGQHHPGTGKIEYIGE